MSTSSHPASDGSCGDLSLSTQKGRTKNDEGVKDRLSTTPSSDLKAWVLGDYAHEMFDALMELGFQAKHVRRWRDVRYYNDGRMERLDLEQPDLVLI